MILYTAVSIPTSIYFSYRHTHHIYFSHSIYLYSARSKPITVRLLEILSTNWTIAQCVAGTRGCTWFVRAPSNNCTISPTDKWISRGEARTVGACTEGAGAVPL